MSGVEMRWDSTGTADVRDDMTCALVTPGDRVTYIALDAGNDDIDKTVLYDASMGG